MFRMDIFAVNGYYCLFTEPGKLKVNRLSAFEGKLLSFTNKFAICHLVSPIRHYISNDLRPVGQRQLEMLV